MNVNDSSAREIEKFEKIVPHYSFLKATAVLYIIISLGKVGFLVGDLLRHYYYIYDFSTFFLIVASRCCGLDEQASGIDLLTYCFSNNSDRGIGRRKKKENRE
mgnify:CR=1 FL=1